ncbi:GNAT family N-acetyltransferase [Sphingomonas abietis]|uniref:GNAT family protein n=1 Tax=Sphingomonas abietis TaxID=3012344 RepID=A0ABY7NN19_9SPHN|nr:GNAT family protein [Sphingomonas abietis]WBO20901.1 GNAT family protein [Sphingomonas abietis]
MIFGRSVVIGPTLPVDVPALYRWADDAETAALNETYRPPNWRAQEDFWSNAANDPSRVFFAIRATGAADIVGYIQIMKIDPIHRSASIGIRIGERADRGRGLGREALEMGIAYCWRQLNLSRISLSVFAHNDAAIALYTGMGFEREGVLRRALFIDGAWVDLVLMALCHPERGPHAPA